MAFAPADLPKDGTAYDVAIAVGILAASGQLPDARRLASTALLCEPALDSALGPVAGVMSLVAAARAAAAGIGLGLNAAGVTASAPLPLHSHRPAGHRLPAFRL